MTYRLSHASLECLAEVHPHLAMVVGGAMGITAVDFTVIEGVRTLERQTALYESGASKTMHSRHLTGHAIDLAAWVDGEISWDWSYYVKISNAMKQAAKELGIPIEWGGDWKTIKDGVHFQLPHKEYPETEHAAND